jgi:TPR repeat protein
MDWMPGGADYATVVRLWRPLAEQGQPRAHVRQRTRRLARLRGRNQLCRKAAEQGNAEAQSNLGLMYAAGRGVPHDYVSAYMWFNLAVASGDEGAKRNRDGVAARMTPTQITEAQRLVREWKSR